MSDSEPAEARANPWAVFDGSLAALLECLLRVPSEQMDARAGDWDARTHFGGGACAPADCEHQRAEPPASRLEREHREAACASRRPTAEHYFLGTVVIPSGSAVPLDFEDDPEAITVETVEALRRLKGCRIPTAADDPLASWQDIRDEL